MDYDPYMVVRNPGDTHTMVIYYCTTEREMESRLASLPIPEGENVYAVYAEGKKPGVFELNELYGLHQNMSPWGWDYCERCLIFFPEVVRDTSGLDFCEECLKERVAKRG